MKLPVAVRQCSLYGEFRTQVGHRARSEKVESPGGISPPGASRSVREPLDSHGSRCSAVSMAQLPMSEERRICAAKPIKPVACSFGFETQPFEFAARPADDIEVTLEPAVIGELLSSAGATRGYSEDGWRYTPVGHSNCR